VVAVAVAEVVVLLLEQQVVLVSLLLKSQRLIHKHQTVGI
jgi:hypothetical protein